MLSPSLTNALSLATRSGIAAALALAIAELFGLVYPIYAMLSAVIVTDLSPAQTRKLGLLRTAGSVLGAVIGALVTYLLVPSPWTIGLAILVTMFLSYFLHLEGTNKIAGYVCAIVMLNHSADPWIYGFWRLAETLLGIAVAILISFIPRLVQNDESGNQAA